MKLSDPKEEGQENSLYQYDIINKYENRPQSLNDHLGTPQILTDDIGTVSWKAVYTPFGEAEISVSTVQNPFRFPGQYYDQETGLHYNWNRYYDPKTGRYLAPDPIGLRGGINLFVYVRANPINGADLRGLFTVGKDCCDKDPTLRQQVESACQMVSARITEPKLRNCISDRCRDGRVTCDGLYCWLFDRPGWSNFFYGCNLCISRNQWISGLDLWGCIAIHEWAHSCGWGHSDGGGVPIEISDCLSSWRPIIILPPEVR